MKPTEPEIVAPVIDPNKPVETESVQETVKATLAAAGKVVTEVVVKELDVTNVDQAVKDGIITLVGSNGFCTNRCNSH